MIGVYAMGLLWLNAYICRDLFFTEYTGHMNSMQGFWTAIARLATSHWWEPGWWPYWDAGMPFEFTYAPLIPGLTALFSHLGGVTPARALQSVIGAFYCLAPVTLFAMCATLTRSYGWSFIAAVVYSLAAPTQLVIPDEALSLRRIGEARRLYLMAVWDETPHVAALTMSALVITFTALAMRTDRKRYWVAAGAFMALTVLANAFGGTILIISLVCLLLTFQPERWRRNLAGVALAGLAAWLVISPTLPPSLIKTMGFNSHVLGESGWNMQAFTALSVIVLGATVLMHVLSRRRTEWWIRFIALLAWVMSMIPFLYYKFGRSFIPQPGRYKVEAEFALAILFVFATKPFVERLPISIRTGLAFFGIALAAEQVVSHRKFAKTNIRAIDVTQKIEFRTAKWSQANLPHGRVAYPGSMAMWFNNFTDTQQFGGSSYPTAYNPVQQQAYFRWVYSQSPDDARAALLWMKAFGVQAYAVPGKTSPEFWKSIRHPEVFGSCVVLWEQEDTRICRLPGARTSPANVMRADGPAQSAPKNGYDLGPVERYTAALESSAPADFRWEGTGGATVRATVPAGHVVSLQVNHHPGWRATANNHEAEVRADGLGLIVVKPDCNGACDIRLVYDGGWELRLCRWASLLTMLGIFGWGVLRWRRTGL
jgi:hypothetical protein